MRVTISVGGKFHAFDLAGQLEKHGMLERLLTSYPKNQVLRYGVPKDKIRSFLLRELLDRGKRFLGLRFPSSYFINDLYDRQASRHVGNPDIFVGWSNESLRSMRKAKSIGAITVIERGSSHIVYQSEILKEEYSKFGIIQKEDNSRIIEKELREYEEADYVSVPSIFVEKTFSARGFPVEKLIHVPYGVNLSAFKQVPKEDDIFRVIFAGGMCLRKGVHYLLQAFAELKLPNSELMLLGSLDDEMKPFFEKYAGSYNYVGRVPQSELYKYYSKGSVFAMMSIEEGLAMVQPQAMACGLPIIATTNTGAEDIVRNGTDGFIIPIRDIEKLKEKLTYLYENPEICKRMGQSAKERVSAGFTWDDYGNKMVAEYERILNKRTVN